MGRQHREAKTVVTQVTDSVESAVLTGVGATLTARDRVVNFVGTVSDVTKVQRELKNRRKTVEKRIRGYERRGTTARNRFEREVKKQQGRERDQHHDEEGLEEKDGGTHGIAPRRHEDLGEGHGTLHVEEGGMIRTRRASASG